MSEVEATLKQLDAEVKSFIQRANEEAESSTKLGKKMSESMAALEEKSAEVVERLLDLEQKQSEHFAPAEKPQTLGDQFIKSEAFKSFAEKRTNKASIEIKSTTVGSDVTVAPDRQSGLIGGAVRRFTLEDLLVSGTTSSNAVEYTRELSFTNNAAETAEAAAKPETNIDFELVSMPVRTIAHWLKLSKQVMDDAPMLVSYINGRLMYGCKLRKELQLLNGNGTGTNISGMLASGNYTAFTPGVGDKEIESLRKAITLVNKNDYMANAIILNPTECEAIDLDEATDGHFRAADPRVGAPATAWGLPIVETNSIPAGKFLVGAFDIANQVWNREGVTIDISDSDGDNFQKNLLTVRAETRCMLATYRPASLVGGNIIA